MSALTVCAQRKLQLARRSKKIKKKSALTKCFLNNKLLHDLNLVTAAKRKRTSAWERKNKKRFSIGPTYLRLPEERRLLLDSTLLSARSQPHFKPSGSPAVHFWVLQAGDFLNSEPIFFSPPFFLFVFVLFFCNRFPVV